MYTPSMCDSVLCVFISTQKFSVVQSNRSAKRILRHEPVGQGDLKSFYFTTENRYEIEQEDSL